MEGAVRTVVVVTDEGGCGGGGGPKGGCGGENARGKKRSGREEGERQRKWKE